jgi:AraC family transcriptional regulator, melibiose operon regulatory protein
MAPAIRRTPVVAGATERNDVRGEGREKPLATMPRSKVFGRFGMRIFKPVTMAQTHTHGHIEINHARHARLNYLIDGDKITIEANTTVVFWANVPHQLVSVEATTSAVPELCNIYLPLDVFLFLPHVQYLQLQILRGGMIVLPTSDFDWAQFRRWYVDYRTHNSDWIDIVIAEINMVFRRAEQLPFEYLRDPWQAAGSASRQNGQQVQHVVMMLRHILENIDTPLANEDFSKVTGLHANYALQLFSRIMQVSPKQFIIRMRLLRARSLLLDTKQPIANIALDCGFASSSQFYEHFAKTYGTTPNKLRAAS